MSWPSHRTEKTIFCILPYQVIQSTEILLQIRKTRFQIAVMAMTTRRRVMARLLSGSLLSLSIRRRIFHLLRKPADKRRYTRVLGRYQWQTAKKSFRDYSQLHVRVIFQEGQRTPAVSLQTQCNFILGLEVTLKGICFSQKKYFTICRVIGSHEKSLKFS